MAKKQPESIEQRLDKQDDDLREILLCLKGDSSLGIEGMIPGQARIEKKLDAELKSLNEWKDGLQKYFDVMNSKGFRWFIGFIVFLFMGMFLYLRYGKDSLAKFFHWMIS